MRRHCCGCGARRVARFIRLAAADAAVVGLCAGRSSDFSSQQSPSAWSPVDPCGAGVAAGELATTAMLALAVGAVDHGHPAASGSEGQNADQKSPWNAICSSGGGRRCGSGPISI